MPHDDSKFEMPFKDRLLLKNSVENLNCLALGHVLTSFQDLEHQLTQIAGYFIDPSDYQTGIIITSELSFRGLVNLVYSLAQHRGVDPKRVQSLRDILKDCFSSEQRRNSLIHSYWEPEPESLQVTRFKYTSKYPSGYKHQVENVTEQNLMEFTTDIRGLVLDLIELMNAHDIEWSECTTFPMPHDCTSSLLPKNLREE